MKSKTIIVDPGHGMSNRRRGVYDPGATSGPHAEASIALDWANTLREILQAAGHKVIRTRVDNRDPCPVSRRDDIAHAYGGDIMVSLHCNAADRQANGTETFYRGSGNWQMAERLTLAVCRALGTKSRGPKPESASQHKSLAVMSFQPCFLIELGFIDHEGDREKMLDPQLRRTACEAIAQILVSS